MRPTEFTIAITVQGYTDSQFLYGDGRGTISANLSMSTDKSRQAIAAMLGSLLPAALEDAIATYMEKKREAEAQS